MIDLMLLRFAMLAACLAMRATDKAIDSAKSKISKVYKT
jgi:hypothetical protein